MEAEETALKIAKQQKLKSIQMLERKSASPLKKRGFRDKSEKEDAILDMGMGVPEKPEN